MSIHINKTRKQFYICYKGEDRKTYTITNAKWKTTLVNKTYMKTIELQAIEDDKRKRNLYLKSSSEITIRELADAFIDSFHLYHKDNSFLSCKKNINYFIKYMSSVNLPLQKALTREFLQKYRINIQKNNIKQNTININLMYIRQMLDFAADKEYLTYELASKLKSEIKSVKIYTEIKEDKLKFWDNDQWNIFINSFDDNDKYKYLFETCYIAGLRVGELRALKWSDLDAEKKVLNINKSADAKNKITIAKTSASNAKVSISNSLIKDLLYLKKETAASDDDFMFFNDKMVSYGTINNQLELHINNTGLPKISIHGLRHSCASRLINAGVSPLLVSKHLRHSSVSITLNVYSHLFPNETEGVIDKIF